MLIIESKQFIVPVIYRNSLVYPYNNYFIGFWNEISKIFIPSMDALEFINLYKNTDLSALIRPEPERGIYHVLLFKCALNSPLPKNFALNILNAKHRLLLHQGKLANPLERYWDMTLNKQDADNRK